MLLVHEAFEDALRDAVHLMKRFVRGWFYEVEGHLRVTAPERDTERSPSIQQWSFRLLDSRAPMSDLGTLQDRLHDIENRTSDRPGEALDDLETLLASFDGALANRHERAQALIQNEDLAGAAHVLGENALLMQRSALLALELREQIRRRR